LMYFMVRDAMDKIRVGLLPLNGGFCLNR
jgi:hypothetical protein